MVSGSGTNLQSILDAVAAGELPLDIAAVGADKPCMGIERAQAAGVPTFLVQPGDYADRPSWNRALEEKIASYNPDYIVFAGFMRIVDAQLVERFSNRIINTHPALLPSFPGAHGVRDALAHGVKITGLTVHFVDAGVDTGPILAQAAVPVLDDDTEETLHERIKVQERRLLVQTIASLAKSHGAESDGAESRGTASDS
ncbi:phosphoribosylglycinamide formyltransferase [uncultured Rothia sp.]|jgi:phosphoribosylglycinamide formyltransferase-1|uniref:phosphoribosylglycinamide formyltransferase n=1 Tax=uncultured Rothia sp. TaxID=316088 RepID=UPI0025FAB899|nr:phosphoribosylglycinamide formyltransferase [uncultured Rothia sp.]